MCLDLPVIPGQEAVVRVGDLQARVGVAEQHLLLLLSAVLQGVGVHLKDVPLDGAHLQRGQRGRAHHADEAMPPAVVIHQVLHPPAHLVVPPLVLAGVMAVAQGRRRGAPLPPPGISTAVALLLLGLGAGSPNIGGLVRGAEDVGSARVSFC